jgi:hypothetical protein
MRNHVPTGTATVRAADQRRERFARATAVVLQWYLLDHGVHGDYDVQS